MGDRKLRVLPYVSLPGRPLSASFGVQALSAPSCHVQVELPASFAQLASTNSDCSSARNGGDLGECRFVASWETSESTFGDGVLTCSLLRADYFKAGQMQKPFEDATFSTPVGSMSDISEFGLSLRASADPLLTHSLNRLGSPHHPQDRLSDVALHVSTGLCANLVLSSRSCKGTSAKLNE